MKRNQALLGFAVIVFAGGASAADWDTAAAVSPSVLWTDNICLESSNTRSDTINSVTPSLNVAGLGARAYVRLNGSVQISDVREKTEDCVRLGGVFGGRANTFVPRVAMNAGTELLRNFLYVDASARVSQNLINAGLIGNDDSLNRAGNTNTSQTFTVSPYIRSRLGGVADLDLRYAYSEQTNTVRQVPDSVVQTVSGQLAQNPELSRLSLGVRGSYSEIEFDGLRGQPQFGGSITSELGSAEVFSVFQASRSWTLTSAVGREWNNFIAFNDELDGGRWDVGAIWQPHDRITVNGGYGERFFGAAPRLDIRYRHLRSDLRLTWSRDVNLNRSLRRGFAGFDDDNIDVEIDPETGAPIGPVPVPTTLARGPIIMEAVRMTYRLTGLRTTLTANASFSEQQRTEDGAENTFFNAGAGIQRRLSENSTLGLRISWLKRKGDEDDGISLFGFDSEEWRYALTFNRTLSERSRVSLLYQYTDRESDQRFFNYTENRVVLTLTLDL